MEEHTPGPWHLEEDELGDLITSANARLIAAAPNLLAACRVCERAITELADAESPTSTDWLNLRTACHLARQAIDAATP